MWGVAACSLMLIILVIVILLILLSINLLVVLLLSPIHSVVTGLHLDGLLFVCKLLLNLVLHLYGSLDLTQPLHQLIIHHPSHVLLLI